MSIDCLHLVASDETVIIDLRGRARPAADNERVMLCTWADTHPAGVAALKDAPRWLQREALGGHLWRKGDCENCPGHQVKP